MAGEALAREGAAYGHPRVLVARRPNGPVVLHDLRGSDEEIHRIRFVIGAATVAGLVLLAITSENLRRLEENEPYTPFWLGFFALSLIVMAGMALRYHAGWEEISLTPGQLQLRLCTGLTGEPPVFFDLARIRRLQVEYDTLRYGGDWYRVQIVGNDGQGLLPADGLLTGIRTYDEALALAFAIAHHFDLTAVPGLQQHISLPKGN